MENNNTHSQEYILVEDPIANQGWCELEKEFAKKETIRCHLVNAGYVRVRLAKSLSILEFIKEYLIQEISLYVDNISFEGQIDTENKYKYQFKLESNYSKHDFTRFELFV